MDSRFFGKGQKRASFRGLPQSRRSAAVRRGLAAGALTFLPLTGIAAVNSYTNSVSGKWETAGNWSLLAAPGAGQSIFITNAGTKTVTIDATTSGTFSDTMTISNLTLNAPAGVTNTLLVIRAGVIPLRVLGTNGVTATPQFDVGVGGLLTITNALLAVDTGPSLSISGGELRLLGGFFSSTGQLSMASVGNLATLTVGGGTASLGGIAAGSASSSMGSISVTNGGTLLVTNGTIGLGNDGSLGNGSGTGSLTVSNATLTAATLNLGSTAGGNGNLILQTSAVVTLSSNLTVLSGSLSSTSLVTVTGGSLTASNGILAIGPAGSGRMTLSGGSVVARQIELGGAGSSGILIVAAGGYLKFLTSLTANAAYIGGGLDGNGGCIFIGDTNHNGSMTVSAGTATNIGGLYVGYAPGSTGAFTNDGLVVVSTNLIIGDCVNNALGIAILEGGEVAVTNAAQTAVLEVRNGMLVVNPGATLVADNLILTNSCGHFFNLGGTVSTGNLVLDPDLDADGDGQNNGAELAAGTDPLDPNSNFRLLDASLTNGRDVRLSWTAVGGHSYVVQRATRVAGGQFTNFLDLSAVISVGGTNQTTTNYIHNGGATNRTSYYRIRLGP
jgi:hypothetical protein